MRRLTALILALGLVSIGTSQAEAKNMNGKFGVGFQQTLLGVQGLSFAYWATPRLLTRVVIGAGFTLDKENSNTTNLETALGVKYVLVSTKYANLSVGARADLAWASSLSGEGDATGGGSNVTQWGVEVPLEVEFWFSDSISVNLATGATFTMVPSEGPLLTPSGIGGVSSPDYKGIGLGAGTLFGNAGFTFYF